MPPKRPAAVESLSTAGPAEPIVFSVPIDVAGVPVRPVPVADRPLHTIDLMPGVGVLTDDEKARETGWGLSEPPEGMESLRVRLSAVEARLAALEGR